MITKNIPVDLIDTGDNIRTPDDIGELARSIELHGLLQPIVVQRTSSGRYRLIAGNRRLLAVQALNEPTIAAIVNDEIKSSDVDYVKLSENIQRQQMTPNEIVAAIDAIKSQNRMLTDAAVARALGKTHAWITENRKAAKAYGDLIESGMPKERVESLTKTDLYEVSKHAEPRKVAEKIADTTVAGGKVKALQGAKQERPRPPKRASHIDDTGGMIISHNDLMVRVLCSDKQTRDRLMKELHRLKAEWA